MVPRLHRLLVIAESTHALLGNLFELEDLGAKDVKGISEPVGAWAAMRQITTAAPALLPAAFRFDVSMSCQDTRVKTGGICAALLLRLRPLLQKPLDLRFTPDNIRAVLPECIVKLFGPI